MKNGTERGARIHEQSIKKGLRNIENKEDEMLFKFRGASSPQNTTIKKTFYKALQKNNLKEEQLQKANLQRNKTLDVL